MDLSARKSSSSSSCRTITTTRASSVTLLSIIRRQVMLHCHTMHCNVTQCIAMSHNVLQCHNVTQVLSHLLLHVFNHGLDCAREKCREQKTAERWKPPEQIQGKEATLWKWCGSRPGQKSTQKIRPVKLPLKTRDLAFQTFCK